MSDNNEIKLPKCMENRYSHKKMVLNAFKGYVDVLAENNNNHYEIIILTPMGMIRGIPMEQETNPDKILKPTNQKNMYSIDISGASAICFKSISEIEEELDKKDKEINIIDNGLTVYLKDATIFPSGSPNQTFKFEQLMVFVDQIIGVSLVSETT